MKKKYLFHLLIVFIIALGIIGIISVVEIKKEEVIQKEQQVEVVKPEMKFGLPVDSFCIRKEAVKRNETLADLLIPEGISYQTIDRIARTSRSVFDVRKINVHNNYYCFCTNDSLKKLVFFIYEIDPVNYVVYQFRDSLRIYTGKKEVVRETKTASGTITSSLWNAMEANDLNTSLAIELSEIYAWTIDFFGIRKGDKFRIVYEESYVDGKPLGISNIYACQFEHANENFYAFQFRQDSIVSYFDETGKSLKKAFLKAPLKYSFRISSRFSYNRFHPVLKIRRPHLGVDYAAPVGTPVYSIGDGVITRKGYQARGGGNFMYIKHNSIYTTSYMHLNTFAKGIAPGVRVHQGQLIGYVGRTGLATGPHLDFRVFKNGSPIDPLNVKAPPVEPVHKQNMATFTIYKDSMLTKLGKIDFKEKSRKELFSENN